MLNYLLLFAILILPSALYAEQIKLSVSSALALADQHDTGLESARIDIETGDALIKEATSGALPVINLAASTGRFVVAPTSSIPALGPAKIRFTPVNDASVGLSILQPLWLGGRLGLALEAAEIYGNLSRTSIQVTRANLKKQIIQDYFRLSFVIEVLKVTRETLTQAISHSIKAKQMFEVGMISEFDLLRAQTETNTLEPEVQRALQAVEMAKTNLCNRLELPPDSELLLIDSLTSLQLAEPPEDDQDFYAWALSRRPEFEVLRLQKSLGEISLKAEERSLYWPNVYFNLSYQNQVQDDHYSNMSPSDWSTSLRWGVTANVPLFNGFATDAKIQKARLSLRKIDLAEKNVQNGVRVEITATLSEYRRAYQMVSGQGQALKLAERAFAISLVRFEQGLGTELDVQDIRLTLSRAKLGYLQGLFDLRMAEAEYARVIENDADLTSGNTK